MSLTPRAWRPLLLTTLAAIACYALTIGNDLVSDDAPLVAYVERLDREGGLWRVITADFRLWPAVPLGYYRPVVLLSLWVDARIPLPASVAHHAANVLLHATSSALVFLLTRALLRSAGAALLAGLIFAVHPVHTESVALVAGRTDLWASLFVLGAGVMWARTTGLGFPAPPLALVAGGLAVALAALSKELGFVAPVVLAAWHVLRLRDRGSWREVVRSGCPWFLAWAGGALVALAMRWLLADIAGAASTSVSQANPRLMLGVWAWYFRMLLIAWPLNAYYLPEQVAVDIFTAAAALGVLVMGAVYSTRRSDRIGALALVWIVVFLVPVSGIRPLPSAIFAERFLYLPSAAFCVLAGHVVQRIGSGWLPAVVRVLGVAALVLAAACISMSRIRDWTDSLAFYATLVQTSPRYAGGHEGLGQAMAERGRRDEAIVAYRQALRLDPGRASAYNSLGALLANEGTFGEAAGLFREAARLDPAFPEARLNLGVACVALRDRLCASEQLDALRGLDREAALRLEAILREAERRETAPAQVR